MKKLRRFLWVLSLGVWLAGLIYYALGLSGPSTPRMILSEILGSR